MAITTHPSKEDQIVKLWHEHHSRNWIIAYGHSLRTVRKWVSHHIANNPNCKECPKAQR